MKPLIRRLTGLGVATALAAVGAAGPARAEGNVDVRRVLTVMVNFQDSKLENPDALRAVVERTYFGKTDSMSAYYAEVSLGRARFEPAVKERVIGPVDLPMKGAGCDSAAMHDRTAEALKARGIGPKDYEHISIVFPDQVAKCPWAGLGTVGGGKTWLPHWALDAPGALIHEIGHNLGFPHHARVRCTAGRGLSTCAEDGFSRKTPMGAGGPKSGMTAAELLHRKWLTPAEHVKVTEPGIFTLRTLYSRGTGPRVLEIPLSDGGSALVEVRGPSGALDSAIAGVHLYRVEDGHYNKSALVDFTKADSSESAPAADALPAGTTVIDPARGTSLQVQERKGGATTVAVRFAGKPEPTEQEPGEPEPGEPEPTRQAQAGNGDKQPEAEGEGQVLSNDPRPDGSQPAGPGSDGTAGASPSRLAVTGTGAGTGLYAGTGAVLVVAGGTLLFARRRRASTEVSAGSDGTRPGRGAGRSGTA
ncbi:hypothetical protein ABTX85_23660 [Streptomyces sp. NPDC096097]|uniref:hypothetical protein n=1 Tax=Streptomyces sp. NPDC096097 TaxID=3155546 RepID=UPI0033292C9F